jgi:hypothetical protein
MRAGRAVLQGMVKYFSPMARFQPKAPSLKTEIPATETPCEETAATSNNPAASAAKLHVSGRRDQTARSPLLLTDFSSLTKALDAFQDLAEKSEKWSLAILKSCRSGRRAIDLRCRDVFWSHNNLKSARRQPRWIQYENPPAPVARGRKGLPRRSICRVAGGASAWMRGGRQLFVSGWDLSRKR